jgi:hypothetical protein
VQASPLQRATQRNRTLDLACLEDSGSGSGQGEVSLSDLQNGGSGLPVEERLTRALARAKTAERERDSLKTKVTVLTDDLGGLEEQFVAAEAALVQARAESRATAASAERQAREAVQRDMDDFGRRARAAEGQVAELKGDLERARVQVERRDPSQARRRGRDARRGLSGACAGRQGTEYLAAMLELEDQMKGQNLAGQDAADAQCKNGTGPEGGAGAGDTPGAGGALRAPAAPGVQEESDLAGAGAGSGAEVATLRAHVAELEGWLREAEDGWRASELRERALSEQHRRDVLLLADVRADATTPARAGAPLWVGDPSTPARSEAVEPFILEQWATGRSSERAKSPPWAPGPPARPEIRDGDDSSPWPQRGRGRDAGALARAEEEVGWRRAEAAALRAELEALRAEMVRAPSRGAARLRGATLTRCGSRAAAAAGGAGRARRRRERVDLVPARARHRHTRKVRCQPGSTHARGG